MLLYASRFETPDTLSFLERPGMKAFTMSEFTNDKYSTNNEAYHGENYDEYNNYIENNKSNVMDTYYESQVKYRAQKLEDIKNINFDSNNPYMFKAQSIFGKEPPESIVKRNLDAYNTLININKQGGNVLLWDTETIGDFVGNPDTEIAAKMAGITEIAFKVKQIKGSESGKFNSRAVSDIPDGSFLFGINKEQKEWLLSIVDKMESGNEDLSRTEISALERASRYSDLKEDAVQIYTGKWKGETYNFVKKLKKRGNPYDAKNIKAGIEVLSKYYEENQNQKMQNVLDYIANFTNNSKKNNRVVGGQNLDYDITAVSRYMSMYDMQKNAISERSMQYIDTYVMTQSIADFNNTTPGELIKQVNPTAEASANLGNAIKAVTGETEFADEFAHNAQADSEATGIFLTNKELKLIERMEKVVNGIEQYGVETTEHNLKDFFIKINKNGHDRRRDVVKINGISTESYQVSNQYWQFEGIGEGTIKDFETDFNYKNGSKGNFKKEGGVQSYAKFTSLDGSGAILYKAIDSEEDLVPFITNNTTLVEKSKLSKEQIDITSDIRRNDLARRDIEGWFEVNNRGFERFKETYDLYNASLQYTEETGKTIKDGMEDFIQWGKDTKNSAVNNYFESSKVKKTMSAKELVVENYNEIDKLPIKFAAIESNKDFFENAYNTIIEASKGQEGSNLINTIIFEKLRDKYVKEEALHPIAKDIRYTVEDLNSVSVLTKNGNYSRIDVSNIEVGTNKLLNGNREYAGKTLDQQATINNLVNVAKDLNEKGLISDKHYDSMIKSYASGKSSWMFAQSIVSSLNETTKNIRNMDVEKAGVIINKIDTFNTTLEEMESINYRPDLELDIPEANRRIAEQLAESNNINIDADTVNLFRNKDLTTSSEMAKSIMNKITGPIDGLSNEYIDYSKNIAKTFNDKMLFIKGSFEKEINGEDNFYEIEKILSKMGYGDEAIGEYRKLFYGGGDGSKLSKSNLKNLNYEHGLVGTDDEIRAMFFKSNNDKSSLFAIYTNNKNYNKVVKSLMDLGENATDREVQDALKEKATFKRIGQLYKAEIADDDVIKELTGHNAQVVMSNQGNGYIKYESMAFNAYYGKDKKSGEYKYFGGILDQGDNHLLSQRRRMKTSFEQMINGEWDRASYNMNSSSTSRYSEEPAPQVMGLLDKNGNIIRSHAPTVKDISSAYMLDLESEGSSIKFKDFFKIFIANDYITDETGKSIPIDSRVRAGASDEGKKAIDAMTGIYKIIDKKFGINELNKDGFKIGSEEQQINKVFNSEEFRIFYEEYFTKRTDGIGSSDLIQKALKNTTYYDLSDKEVKALEDLGKDGLIDLLAKATKKNKAFDEKLSNTFETLSNAFVDNSISEAATKHGRVKIGKDVTITTGAMFNSGYSANIRPTYPQLENYRPFNLDYGYFEDIEGLENDLGIRFREIFASESYNEKISNLNKEFTRDLSEGTALRRHVVGAIQSMSQSDFNTYRDTRLTNLLDYNKKLKDPLDPEALKKVYNEMIEGVNLYEGKGYLRPSLANNKFYMIGDPKTIYAQEIKNVFELGTDLEIAETEKILRNLEGKSVKSGDVIARKQVNNRWKDITYKGETIEKLTRDDIEELKNKGKAVVNVTKQLESMKIQAGQEKFTAGSLFYYNNVLDDTVRNEELKMTLSKFGIDYKDSFEENLKIMNRYTDMAMDAITDTLGFDLKTIAVVNTNITKHSTDVAIESTWNLLFKDFQGEEGLRELSSIIGDIKVGDGYITDYIKTSEGINYAGLIYNNKLGIDKNVINIQDQVIDRFKKSDNIKAQTAIKNMEYMASHNMAYIGTQRQFMNTFQGKNQKFDRRYYQGLLMQQKGNYTEGYSREYADLIAENLKDGVYDKKENIGNIIGFKDSEVNRLRAGIVKDRRGTLSGKLDSDTVYGIYDALNYMDDPNSFRLDQKSIIKVSAEDVLKSIPSGDSAVRDYRNTIFKEDGKLSKWMLSKADENGLENIEHIASNSFYLDLSRYGGAKLNGKQTGGVVLPLISGSLSEDKEIYFGKTAKSVRKFLNDLRDIEKEYAERLDKKSISETEQKEMQAKINDSLENLFKTLGEEINSNDKDSLISKAEYKMVLPNSAGLLASEAITPTLIEGTAKSTKGHNVKTRYNSNRIKNYINEILEDLENDTLDKNKIERYKDDLRIRNDLIKSQQEKILNPNDDPIKHLGISERYSKYLKSYKFDEETKQWVRRNGVIESVMLVGEQMFTETEMDLGHIGHQIASDMYAEGNENGILTHYDSLSKFTGTDFMISDDEFKAAFDEKNIYKAFGDDTDFARELYNKMDLMLKEGKSYHSQKNIITEGQKRNIAAFNLFEEELNNYLKSYKVYNNNAEIAALETEAAKKEILNKVEKNIFGEFGAKYAEEVGILAEISRYPFFSETNILTVRTFLDRTIRGKEGIFLSSLFSLFQNLDFDGDQEFIKFLGNGGLIAKDTANEKLKREYDLINRRFNEINEENNEAFAKALEDSVKEYRYGDREFFKLGILKDISKEDYKRIENIVLDGLKDEKDKKLLLSLKESEIKSQNEFYDFILSKTKAAKKIFSEWDKKTGASLLNPEMIKASTLAKTAKLYIGNFSKPNLELRDALTWMLSSAENDDELKKLIKIRNSLFSYGKDTELGREGIEPKGLLTELEQKGIDTKHIHDAELLNTSTDWRLGIKRLFSVAEGSTPHAKVDITKERAKAVRDLVTGAKKVFFEEAGDNDEAIDKIVEEIMDSNFLSMYEYISENSEKIRQMANEEANEIYGKLYIRSVYEMSLMDGAYDAFKGTFSNREFEAKVNFIRSIDNGELEKLVEKGINTDTVIKESIKRNYKKHLTDERFNVFGRNVRRGDLLLFASDEGPLALVYDETRKNNKGKFQAVFHEYDINEGKIIENEGKKNIHIIEGGVTIRDLNENIKQYNKGNKKYSLLDFSRTDVKEQNINVGTYIGNIHDRTKYNELVKKPAAQVAMAHNLQELFDNPDRFDNLVNLSNNDVGVIINGYGGEKGTGAGFRTIISRIVGTDKERFANIVSDMESRIEYGLNSKKIIGYNGSAKELMREINKQIASNPNNYYGKFTKHDDVASIMKDYLKIYEDIGNGRAINIRDESILTRNIKDIELSNSIEQEISNIVKERDTNLYNISEKFYGDITNGFDEAEAFKAAQESYQAETENASKRIYEALNKTTNPKESMMYHFGWQDFKTSRKNDFLLDTISGTIDNGRGSLKSELIDNSRVGFGDFTGVKVEDLNSTQAKYIQDEIEKALPNLSEDSIEYLAAKNTQEVLSHKSFSTIENVNLDFTTADTLRESYESVSKAKGNVILNASEEERIDAATSEMFKESGLEDYINAAKKAAEESKKGMKKKTLLGELKGSFKSLDSSTKKKIAIGATALIGLSALGLAGHPSSSDNNNIEVPAGTEENLGDTSNRIKFNNKNDLDKPNAPTQASSVRKSAPPSPKPKVKKNRTIYHDANSGFNFKVSANSYNKLTDKTYSDITDKSGLNNSSLNITRDNSKITNNWLEEKFAQLTE
jgi:hypothetical protein